MDLPTCPACGQSVLDEVDECPFCGASMSGKPGAKSPEKPREKKPAQPAASGSRKGARGQAPSSTGGGKTRASGEEEDPFAVESGAADRAIPLSPRPRKGRSRKYVCPMCETPGFGPAAAAGQEVRCPNRDCMVPVFTAPDPKPQHPQGPEPRTSRPSPLLTVGLVLLGLAGGGVGAWYFLVRDSGSEEPRRTAVDTHRAQPKEEPERDISDLIGGGGDPQAGTEERSAAALTPQELRRRALALMIESSQQRSDNRSKPYCRRLAGEALALSGDLDRAREQVDSLSQLEPYLPFYEVTPLVEIAWQEMESGRDSAVRTTLDRAWQAAQQLPRFGRDPIDTATALAAVLVAAGRIDDAQALLSKHAQDDALGQLSARLQIAAARGRYTLDWPESDEPLLAWSAPQAVAVTWGLAARGEREAALNWARGRPSVEARTECLIAWSDAVSAGHETSAESRKSLPSAAAELPAAGRARYWARVAGRQLAAGRRDRAMQSLETARSALEAVPADPAPLMLPEQMKDRYEFQLPEAGPLRMAATASAETARVEAALGRSQQAWNHLGQALQFTRAITPSPPAVQARLDEIETRGIPAIQQQLKTALELSSDDEARRRFRTYRRKLESLREKAQSRFDLQVALLERATTWDLRERIWEEIRSRSQVSDIDQREPYFETSLPWVLAYRFHQAGEKDRVQAIQRTVGKSHWKPDPELQLQRAAAPLLAEGRFEQAAGRMQSVPGVDEAVRQQRMLETACRLARKKGLPAAMGFVQGVNNAVLRETAYELIAGMTAGSGEAQQAWSLLQESDLGPTATVAYCRGLVGGLVALESAG